ncbi:MAG: 5'-nucleotidase C-terminal domain-containing protein [Alphaproteobacteria bacterium]|nr:5'-nucleotidase C-terminal domain-containing protein [Alphaproteobacteria bacterium]
MSVRLLRLTASWFLLAALAACVAPVSLDRLTVLHVNDVHSRLQPVNEFGSACTPQDLEKGACVGGAARLAAIVAALRDEARRRGEALLLLDAGDQFQGSLFYTYHRGAAELAVMNQIGFDAMAIGNHEFDNGPPVLASFISGAGFPVLSANIDARGEPHLAGLIRSHAVLQTLAGRIAVIGLTAEDTPTISSSGPRLVFRRAEEVLPPLISVLESESIGRIVVLSHLGLARDREVARRIKGIDLIVGGHSHSLLSNSLAGAVGPYPIVETAPDGTSVPIVQAGAHGRYLGRIEIVFGPGERVASWSGDTMILAQALPEDPTVAAIVARFAEPLEALRLRAVGRTDIDLEQRGCRAGECAIGNLVADAMLAATVNQGVQAAITNGGGLRAGLRAGTITYGDLLTVLPFQNTIATLALTGADLRSALEHGLSGLEEGRGRFPQVAGLRFAFDPARPTGARILAIEIREADGRFAPLEPARRYRIATNDFLRRGGDGYAIFRERAIEPYDFGPNVEEVMVEHLARHSPVRPTLDGRISRR